MSASQLSGSLADLWPETAIILLAVQDEGSKMTTLAQGTLRRNGSTGVVQQGVRQAQVRHKTSAGLVQYQPGLKQQQ
jgi:hypothetical protein